MNRRNKENGQGRDPRGDFSDLAFYRRAWVMAQVMNPPRSEVKVDSQVAAAMGMVRDALYGSVQGQEPIIAVRTVVEG